MRLSLPTLVLLDLFWAVACQSNGITVTAPLPVPSDASRVVDQSFLGFASEAASFPNFTHPFSQNLFNVFHNATGAPVVFRVGGTSMDHSNFDLSQEEDWDFPDNRTDNLQSNITFGKHWFDGFGTLQNIKFMLHVPLARFNRTNAVKFTRQCLKVMGSADKLHALEIGNEVDAYATQGSRSNQTWDPARYAQEVKTYMDLITNNVTDFPKTGKIFQVYDKATEIEWHNQNWTIENFMGNLTKVVDMTRIKQVAEHYYQARGKKHDHLQNTLLNHTDTMWLTHAQFHPEIEYLRKKSKEYDLDFVLSEVGNTIGSIGNASADLELAASLGAAVWTVDWMLYAMSLNVDRINMQMGRTFPFAAWQPNQVGHQLPHLHAPFFGHVFVADFISREGQMQVLPLSSPLTHVSAYAGYHSGKLAKVAITNLAFWKESQPPRPSVSVTLDLKLGSQVKEATVRKLHGPDSVALENVTWAGKSWPYDGTDNSGMPKVVRHDTETIPVKDGKIVVDVEASGAVLVTW